MHKKYVIDYGYGYAILITPYEPELRFGTLANTCFGIRKSIICFRVVHQEEYSEPEYFEELSFGGIYNSKTKSMLCGDRYAWREDGARKMIEPEYMADNEWNTDFCDSCRYEGGDSNGR